MQLGANELFIIKNTMHEHLGYSLMILLVVEGVYLLAHNILMQKRDKNIESIKRFLEKRKR